MPTPAEIDDLDQEVSALSTLAAASLVSGFTGAAGDPLEVADELRSLVLDVASEFTLAGAGAAVDFYSSVRPAGGPSFTPGIPDLSIDKIVPGGTLNWLTEPLTVPTRPSDPQPVDLDDVEQVILRRGVDAVDKAMRDAVNEAIGMATEDDSYEVKYARIPSVADPCAYCTLRASRGAVFWSETSATRGDHRGCRCKVTAVFPGEPLPYQLKPFFAKYQAGLEQQEGRGLKALLSGMRRANGIR